MISLINAVNYLIQWLQMCMNCFFFYYILTPRYSFKKTVSISCAVMTVVMAAARIADPDMLMRQIIYCGVFFVICRKMYRDSVGVILFSNCILYFIMISCEFAVTFFYHDLGLKASSFPEGSTLMFGSLLWIALYFPAFYFFILFWRRRKNTLLPKSIYVTLLFPLSQFFLMHAVFYYSIWQFLDGDYHMSIIFCMLAGIALCIFADLTLFQVMLDNSKKERLSAQIEMMNEQAGRELLYYSSINDKIQEIRKIRQDFNSQLQAAYGVALKDREGGQKKAVQLLSQLEKEIGEHAPVYYCANLIVNVILEEKVRMAGKEQIDMDISVELPEQLAIEKVDLCSIFSNMLDNAIHGACLTDKSRPVTVKAWVRAGYCIIKVTNPFVKGTDADSSRGKDGNHGYGLLILNAMAEKYQGEFSVSHEDGIFTADMKLRIG